MRHAVSVLFIALAIMTLWARADNMKAFPAAEKGMARYVLSLPQETNEANLKVEIVIGKTIQIDAENRYFFAGKIETKIATGWGFPYYVLPELGPLAGTLMAVDP